MSREEQALALLAELYERTDPQGDMADLAVHLHIRSSGLLSGAAPEAERTSTWRRTLERMTEERDAYRAALERLAEALEAGESFKDQEAALAAARKLLGGAS